MLAPFLLNFDQTRFASTKHWNPKWKKLRQLKVLKVDIPNLNEKSEDLSEDKMRNKLKELGIMPPRPWVERQFFLSSTGAVFEPYVPPEGDGKISPITAQVLSEES